MNQNKKEAFFENARLLYKAFQITPLMYGSLGLEYLTGENLNADDLDILIPEIFITERWNEFCTMLEENGYTLTDEHEHTFTKDGIEYSYASIENLEPFADVSLSEIKTLELDGTFFRLLSLKQYLKVYEASSKDGYRVHNRNKKDFEKIEFIREKLS